MTAPLNDRLVDDEVVERVMAGRDPGRALSVAERREVVRRCDARGYTNNTTAHFVLGCNTRAVKQLRTGKGAPR